MKRGLSFLVMIISLVGTGTGCKKASEKTTEAKKTEVKPPPPVDKASGADPWTQPDVKKDPLKQVFFWKAEKDGKATYLLGTMHMGIEPETRLPQIVWDKLDAAKTFAMEADISDPKLASAVLREKGALVDDIGSEYWAKLEKAVGPQVAAQMSGLTPMGAAAMMSLKDLPKTSPMDGVLLGRAINQKKTIVYLE